MAITATRTTKNQSVAIDEMLAAEVAGQATKRVGVLLHNAAASTFYYALGDAPAATTDYSDQLAAYETVFMSEAAGYPIDALISGWWAGAGAGKLMITELRK